MNTMTDQPFHPLIWSWFTETYGKPTAVQEEAWPLIAGGAHVLALAPTGSGKTLTAFLSAISRFADGTYPAEDLSVLYVSPLKALNEDIRRNLLEPIAAIGGRFSARGLPFPEIRLAVRSGDTPQMERRCFLIKPPSILALTPESLAIILLNPRGRAVLSKVKWNFNGSAFPLLSHYFDTSSPSRLKNLQFWLFLKDLKVNAGALSEKWLFIHRAEVGTLDANAPYSRPDRLTCK
jgi:hypothetical protein